jgi:hypothetical protein
MENKQCDKGEVMNSSMVCTLGILLMKERLKMEEEVFLWHKKRKVGFL